MKFRRPTDMTTMQIYFALRKKIGMPPHLAMQCAMRDGTDRRSK